jgi:HAD superfamily hydrolase (TIGR01484 family)
MLGGYSRSHGQQGGGEPEGFPRVSLSPLIFVLSLLVNTISLLANTIFWEIRSENQAMTTDQTAHQTAVGGERLGAIAQAHLHTVQLVATDMDGTLTIHHKFSTVLLQALEALAQAEVPVVIVTGRSAGWVSGVASYLPIVGAIAENGGIFYRNHPETSEFLVPIANIATHRQQLQAQFQQLQAQFPQIRETADNTFRLTDWTFDVQGLTVDQLQTMQQQCQAAGWGFTYSTVQCHIKPLQQEKAAGLMQVLQRHFPDYRGDRVLTLGDSLNDESLFDAQRFPLSVGVANVREYCDRLRHCPRYITTQAEGAGFAELVQQLLAQRPSVIANP